jgi:hypothetical protein
MNFNRGVNTAAAPTNLNTSIYAKNLAINLDGSLSVRKPLKLETTATGAWTGFAPLHNRTSTLFWNANQIAIFTGGSRDAEKYKIRDYTGASRELVFPTSPEIFKIEGSPEIIRLNDATVLGNVFVKYSKIDSNPPFTGIDEDLYDDPDSALPRYVKIFRDPSNTSWIIEIISPEMNIVSPAEGDFAINYNLTLDSPLAVRDSYENAVPRIGGILAYVRAKETPDGLVPTDPIRKAYTSKYSIGLPYNNMQDKPTTTHTNDLFRDTATCPVKLAVTYSCSDDFKAPLETGNDYILTGDCVFSAHLLDSYAASENIKVSVTAVTTVEFYIGNTRVYKNIHGTSFVVSSTDSNNPNEVSLETDVYTYKMNNLGSNKSATAAFTTRVTAHVLDLSSVPETVSDLTESVKKERYVPVSSFERNQTQLAFLKAFCKFPFKIDATDSVDDSLQKRYYATWSKSTDGIDWTPLEYHSNSNSIFVRELNPNWDEDADTEENASPTSADYTTHKYYYLQGTGADEELYDDTGALSRIDFLEIPTEGEFVDAAMYRFKIIAVDKISEDDVEYDESLTEPQYRVRLDVDERTYIPIMGSNTELVDIEIGNASLGRKLYHRKAIYSYGDPSFKTNVLVSDAGSFVTPYYNTITVESSGASEVNCLLAWRDYLVSATSNSINLHTKQDEGYFTKLISTSVGIEKRDSRCCKAVLNGILFKSGPKVYQLVPNVYSGDDTVLNIKVLSDAVEDYLVEYEANADEYAYTPFAIATESEYILMLPQETSTMCLRFEYVSGHWAVYEYPVLLKEYWTESISKIHVFGTYNDIYSEWVLDSDCGNTYDEASITANVPIAFELDTGQKTDGIFTQKQFVETKFIFATEDDYEMFPMQAVVAIDGDPHVSVIDVNSDAPFWKLDTTSSKGVAGTAFRLSSEGCGRSDSGILRQLILRYSGKGRSIRHILKGTADSNFRLYEAYVKYKNLNIKK